MHFAHTKRKGTIKSNLISAVARIGSGLIEALPFPNVIHYGGEAGVTETLGIQVGGRGRGGVRVRGLKERRVERKVRLSLGIPDSEFAPRSVDRGQWEIGAMTLA